MIDNVRYLSGGFHFLSNNFHCLSDNFHCLSGNVRCLNYNLLYLINNVLYLCNNVLYFNNNIDKKNSSIMFCYVLRKLSLRSGYRLLSITLLSNLLLILTLFGLPGLFSNSKHLFVLL